MFLIFWRNVGSDGADWTSTGRLFQSRGPAAANEWSPIVTSRDGRTSRRLEVDERSWPPCLDGRSATYRSWPDKYWGAVPWRARYMMTASLNLMQFSARSQWKLARASVICSERRRPAISDTHQKSLPPRTVWLTTWLTTNGCFYWYTDDWRSK